MLPRISRPALVAALAAVALSARAATAQPDAGPSRHGGTLTVGAIADLRTMNPLVAADETSRAVQREVLFMPLLKLDARQEMVPWLAERWDTARVAGDSLELTFHLRRDVSWHDGRPTTARDVVFTFSRAVDPATRSTDALRFEHYRKTALLVGDHTVRFRLRPHSEPLQAWADLAILPEHLLGAVPAEALMTHPFGAMNPVGNGPFRFVSRVPGREWVFEADPRFPAALGGPPYADRLVYRVFDGQDALLDEVRAGRVDVGLTMSPAQEDRIRSDPALQLLESPFRQWVYVAWNERLPVFADARVRRALTMAIDRRRLVETLLHGHADVGRATVPPAHWAFDPEDAQTLLPYDPAAARRLLAEAGWADRNGDGVLDDAAGRPFRFTLSTNQGNPLRREVMERVAAQLREVGVVAELRLVEWNTLVGQLQGTPGPDGRRARPFEAVVNAWVDYPRKDDTDILHCRTLEEPFQNVGYCNPRADTLIDRLSATLGREAARPLWREYQRLMAQEAPYTVLYYPRRLTAVRRRVHGVPADPRGDFADVARWWVEP